MKKILSLIVFVMLGLNANAIPLFPFFTDLAGNYHDGPVDELIPIGVECMYSDKSPFFNTIAAADEFLNDVLPSSNYIIQRKTVEINGIKTEMYASPMEGGVTSILCLLEIPEKGLYVVYDELDEDLLKVEEQPAAGSGYFE